MEELTVVLIRNDRRLEDHEALTLASRAARYFLLLLPPPKWEEETRLSENRKAFIRSSMNAFHRSLGEVPLHFSQNPAELLQKLSSRFKLKLLAEEQGSTEEEAQLRELKFPVQKTRVNTVFHQPRRFPTYTPFRKEVEAKGVIFEPLPRADLDPAKSHVERDSLFKPFAVGPHPFAGEASANKRVDYYLHHFLPHYLSTRNDLEGEDSSSKFSYFLAHGELSARALYLRIRELDPTNWLLQELIWRDFFWHSGVNFTLPSTGKKLDQWELTHPLAKAIYSELVHTGYISNRSRQILASYLIYELGMDWKQGGAIFETHLLDYDVFVNWGNWQYIAGVRFDPRGGRKFNLDLQVEKYDPRGEYQKKWGALSSL